MKLKNLIAPVIVGLFLAGGLITAQYYTAPDQGGTGQDSSAWTGVVRTDAGVWSTTTAGSGTVTSVDMSVPTGLAISGNPITTSGTLALAMDTGYVIVLDASTTNWNTAYTDRLKWDGGATGLVAATGRTSLELGSMALLANTGSTTITTLGTIATGVWSGTAIDISDKTNLTAGRSLTMSGDSVEADAELYTDSITFSVMNATSTQNPAGQHRFPYAVTITKVIGSTNNSTSSIQLDERAAATPYTAGTDVLSAALELSTATASTTAFANATIAADAVLSLNINTMNGNSTTSMIITIYFTVND